LADQRKKSPSYRWAAFAHWLNLAVLAGGAAAGAIIDPAIWLALVPLEGAMLWIIPDLPPFRASIDKRHRARALQAERAYCLEQLWRVQPRPDKSAGEKMRGWFVSDEPDDYDERIVDRGETEVQHYLEMRAIVHKLREMVPLADVRVTEQDLFRLDEVINGYLRILIACRPLAAAVYNSDVQALQGEHSDVLSRLEGADSTLRPVLLERKRLLEKQLQRIPRLQATLELLHARAEAIVYQLRNVHSQVLTDPGTAVQGMLDEMEERHELMGDPLEDLRADQSVKELLDRELEAGSAPVPAEPPPAARRAAAARREGSRR